MYEQSVKSVPDVHQFLSSIGASESCYSWRKYVCGTCMRDFFTYISEHTLEAAKALESIEFLVILFSQAVLGILKLAAAGERALLDQLEELQTGATIAALEQEDQETFSSLELESLRMTYSHHIARAR